MLDYAPVLSDEDEEEQRRRQSEYPPADARGAPADFGGAVYSSETPVTVSDDTDSGIAPTRIPNGTKLEPIPMGLAGAKMDTSSPVPADIMPPAMRTASAGGPSNDLVAVAPPPAPRMPSASPGARPQRSDYQAPELHGWKKGLGAVFTGMAAMGGPQSGEQAYNKIFVAPRERAENDYQAATSAYDKDSAQRLALQREGREQQTAASEGKLRDAQTENLLHPQAKQGTPEESTLHDLMTGDNGNPRINPDTQKPYSYLEAFKATKEAGQEAKPEKTPNDFDQFYQDYIKDNGLPDNSHSRLQARSAYAAAGQTPQRPPVQLAIGPDGTVIELKPGAKVAPGTKTVAGDLATGKPTADEQRRADLAGNLNENFDQLEDILQRRPDLFGPLAGRFTSLREKLGTNDPDIAALATIQHQVGMAQISAHGMRSAHGIDAAADSLLNSFNNGPDAVRGAIKAARQSVGTFTQDVENAKAANKPAESKKEVKTKDFGDAAGKPEGSTGKLPDGTKVVVKGGRIVAQ